MSDPRTGTARASRAAPEGARARTHLSRPTGRHPRHRGGRDRHRRCRATVVLFNRGAAKIFGYTPEEVVGQPLVLLLPGYRDAHAGQVEDFARSPAPARLMGERREVHGRRKDGTEFPAEVSISRFGSGREMLFTAIVRDTTERTRYEHAQRGVGAVAGQGPTHGEEAAAREEPRHRARIVETANEGIWLLDARRTGSRLPTPAWRSCSATAPRRCRAGRSALCSTRTGRGPRSPGGGGRGSANRPTSASASYRDGRSVRP